MKKEQSHSPPADVNGLVFDEFGQYRGVELTPQELAQVAGGADGVNIYFCPTGINFSCSPPPPAPPPPPQVGEDTDGS
jgi:hypothetical protein